MAGRILFSQPVTTAALLILSGMVFCAGGVLYAGRAILKWPAAGNPVYLRWERGFVIAAALISVLGFTLLEKLLEADGDSILAPTGWVMIVIGTAVVVTAETFFISRQEWAYAPVVAFVVLAFLGQAAFGAALLRTGLLPGWAGWFTILWNVGWLVVLPLVRPQDMYYPWLHYVGPLVIGITLLVKA